MNGHEVELDVAHEHAGKQISALLSAALTAAQAAAQISADRARQREAAAEAQARDAARVTDQQTRAQQQAQRRDEHAAAAAQRQAERQARTEEALRHKQWGLKPDAQWLADNPLSAASAWASADTHRHTDPIAARHAEQWETVFAKAGISVDDVRADAAAAASRDSSDGTDATSAAADPAAESTGEMAATEVAAAAVVAGAADVAEQLVHEEMLQRAAARFHAAPDLEGQIAATQAYNEQMTRQFGPDWASRNDLPEAQQAAARWQQLTAAPTEPAPTSPAPTDPPPTVATAAQEPAHPFETAAAAASTIELPKYAAYAGGDPIAILGGRGVSKPPAQMLAEAQRNPDVASLNAAAARSLQVEPVAAGVER